MFQFVWKDAYLLHVPEMDEEHKILLQRINEFVKIVEMKQYKNVVPKYKFLYDYVLEHFHHEELYLQSISYPQFEEHQKIHKNLIARMDNIYQELRNVSSSREMKNINYFKIVSFFNDWLLKHILSFDMQYASYSRKSRQKSA
jgi:hemerythrin-like metal-binding protein